MGKPGDNFVFYMIPQSLAGVSVKIYFADATPPIAVNLAGTWKPGTTKTYALSQNTSSWQYVLTATGPTPAEYSATSTGNYTIQSYRKDGAILKPVPWKVVGYSTDGGLTWSNNKPTWFTGLTKENGDGSTNLSGETGIAILQPDALINKLAQMNAALKQNPKGSPTNYYDLSMYDIKGIPRLSRSTANCYIISHPGYYKIPLVYGNAITNGNNNTNAYQTSNTGTYILTHFKDHNNQDITNPWITQSNGGTNAPNGAKLVWADEKGLITNLAVTGSGTNAFVQFHVPEDKIKNGNAVIAVMRGSTVVWSWHLWFIHDDALNTITCTNFQGYDYKFTEETLGMKYTSWTATSYTSPRSVKVKVVQCYGQGNPMVPKEGIITITQKETNLKQGSVTYYQGGRKDAHPSTEEVKEGAFNTVSLVLSIPDGIQHPENFYYGYSSSYIYNLWSANNTTKGYNDNNVVKTVYDPCPAGFKLPPSNAFTGFSFEGRDNSVPNTSEPWNNGCNFNNKITDPDATVYFPVSGLRFGNQLRYIGTRSFYWSAVPYEYSNYCALYFGSDFMLPRSYFGNESECAVHPIADN